MKDLNVDNMSLGYVYSQNKVLYMAKVVKFRVAYLQGSDDALKIGEVGN
jgi:hypothetical protein